MCLSRRQFLRTSKNCCAAFAPAKIDALHFSLLDYVLQVPAECPQEIADLVEACLSMEPQVRPSARDVFDVISKVKAVQDQQATQDPWHVDDGPKTPLCSLHSQQQPAADAAGQGVAAQPGQVEAPQESAPPILGHVQQDGTGPDGVVG